jgi:hypothetical protein
MLELRQYRSLFAWTPAPTAAQCEAFVAYVARRHSWYKHLPLARPGVAFCVYLDPGAGMQRVDHADGRVSYQQIGEGDTLFHHAMLRTADYRQRFGQLNVLDQGAPGFELHGGGQLRSFGTGPGVLVGERIEPIPAQAVEAGEVEVTALLHERAREPWLWERHFRDVEPSADPIEVAIRQLAHTSVVPFHHARTEVGALIAPERERQLRELRAAVDRAVALVYAGAS